MVWVMGGLVGAALIAFVVLWLLNLALSEKHRVEP